MDSNQGSILFEEQRAVRELEKNDRSGLLKATVLKSLFNVYKYFLGPFLKAIGGPGYGCRYTPTCSQYCLDAFRKHSLLRAVKLVLMRLLRCHPWSKTSTYDPVPCKKLNALRNAIESN